MYSRYTSDILDLVRQLCVVLTLASHSSSDGCGQGPRRAIMTTEVKGDTDL